MPVMQPILASSTRSGTGTGTLFGSGGPFAASRAHGCFSRIGKVFTGFQNHLYEEAA
jgi:hypothetical protein